MADDNRISATISDADIAIILTKLQDCIALLPWLFSISDEDKMVMPKMGDKSVGFDDKCGGYMGSNPEFLPGFVHIAEVLKDRALRAQVLKFLPQFLVFVEMLKDTFMVINSEIWMADLAYYQGVREGKRRGLPGADTIFNDLRQRFPGNPQPAPPGPNP